MKYLKRKRVNQRATYLPADIRLGGVCGARSTSTSSSRTLVPLTVGL
jgi:hypothetical protein